MRLIKHLFESLTQRRHFPAATLAVIQQAIAAGEQRHRGEMVFAVEPGLRASAIIAGETPRARAEQVFSHLRVWDTRENTGVLVYVLLADRAVEIIADRGITAVIPDTQWLAICERLLARYAAGEFESGTITAIAKISDLLAAHFPANPDDNPDELPNRAMML
ncbi:MAG: TPM domain-containing protein [Dokdonella sp.]